MSRHSKKNLDVIGPIQAIAANAMSQIGFFHNGINLSTTKLQKGIIRTNCIDCLDRTNAAQFIICKEALTHQLRSLKIISETQNLDYDSDLINVVTEIFHDHGDTIAIQYGGSNLVNTMDSYRRINQWSSHKRSILIHLWTLCQEAINLFWGIIFMDKPKMGITKFMLFIMIIQVMGYMVLIKVILIGITKHFYWIHDILSQE